MYCFHCKSQEKTKTKLMKTLEGQTKSIMVFSKVAYLRSLFKNKDGGSLCLMGKLGTVLSSCFPIKNDIGCASSIITFEHLIIQMR